MTDREPRREGWHDLLRRVIHPTRDDLIPLLGAVIALIGIVVGAAVPLILNLNSRADETVGRFSNLIDGQRLSSQQLVIDRDRGARFTAAGTVANAKSARVYCMVRDESGSYYPAEADVQDGDDQWTADIGLGPSGDSEIRRFTVLLVLVNDDAHLMIESLAKEPKPGIEGIGKALPDGVSELATVNILRTP